MVPASLRPDRNKGSFSVPHLLRMLPLAGLAWKLGFKAPSAQLGLSQHRAGEKRGNHDGGRHITLHSGDSQDVSD